MRWFATITLAALSVVGVAVLLLPATLGLRPGTPPTSASVKAADELKPDAVTKIELTIPGQQPLVLMRSLGGWTQPGGWPVREKEANELLAAVCNLRTRFLPIPATGDDDLKKYGLADPKTVVAVSVTLTDGRAVALAFGQPDAQSGESATARPAYVRIESRPEVLKVGPDTLAVVSRPPDGYRRRQLFLDSARVKFAGGGGRSPLVTNGTAQVRVEGPDGAVTLKRTGPTPAARRDPSNERSSDAVLAPADLAEAWEVAEPVRDRPDPAKLKALLTAVPDLWVEGFTDKKADAAGLALTGLDKPERSVVVTPAAGGAPVALRIGKVARTTSRREPGVPMGQFPAMPREVTESYHYAKFDGNDLIFEVKADRFADLFVKADDLRDPALAHFEAGDVTALTVAAPNLPPIALTKKKGNKDAERDEDKQDRWYVGDRLAEAGKVTELLDQLGRLDAKTPADRMDAADAAKLTAAGLDKDFTVVTVTAQPKAAEGDAAPPAKTIKFQIGKDDAEKKKLNVRVEGWPRVNMVDDAVAKTVGRPVLAYRSRKLFDTAEVTLNGLTVAKAGGEGFALTSKPKVPFGTKWSLTQPAALDTDDAKSAALAGEFTRLEAVEYVDDAPKPEDLAGKYGLAMPRYTLDLAFTGTGAKPGKLEVGAAKEGGSEVFARLDGGGVFTIGKAAVDALDKGALDLLPLALWTTTPDKVTTVAVQRGEMLKDKYTLASAAMVWKISGPYDAPASGPEAFGLASGLAALKAEKFTDLKTDPARHGFDAPQTKVAVTFLEPKTDSTAKPPEEVQVTKTLVIGKALPDNPLLRYAVLEGGGAVFALSVAQAAIADKPALHWLDRNLLQTDTTKIARLELQGANKESVVLVKDDKGEWKPEGATFPLDKPSVEGLLAAAAAPPVVRLADYGPAVKWADYGLDAPAFTVVAATAGDKPERHTILLGKEEPSGERYVRVDGSPAVGVVSGSGGAALARGKLELVDRTLLTFDPQQLTSVVRKAGAAEFELAQAGIAWEVAKPAKFKADAPTVEELIAQLARLQATKVAAYAPADRKPFGLDAPAATVTLKVGIEKPEDKVLLIGKPVDDAKPDGPRYAMLDTKGEAVVGVLPAGLANRLLQEPIRFKDKTLAKFVDADKVTIARGDRTLTAAKVNGTWKLTAPLATEAEQAELDELVDAAAKLRADEVLAEKPADLKPFGLDPPQATVKFYAGDKVVLSLLVGGKEKDGPRLQGKLEGGDLVVLFDRGMSARLGAEVRKRAAWSGVDASQVQSLVVSAEGANYELRKAGPLWVDPTRPQDAIDAAKVSETLAALAGLKAERYAADKDADMKLYGLEKPSRVIVVGQQGGVTKTLQLGGEVGGSDGKQVYARVIEGGRTDVMVLSAADTALLRRDRAAYAAAK